MKSIQQKSSGERDSSVELLRIIAIIMIIFHHFAVYGGFKFDNSLINIPRLWYTFIAMGGKIGVDLFVIISGYFLINDKRTTLDSNKIFKLWGEVFFYSIGFFIIFGLTGQGDIGIEAIFKSLFPITFGSWWFASTYFVLFLIHPFLNMFLNSLKKETYQKFILMSIVCWCIIPTFTAQPFEGNYLIWFISLYSISAYIRLYGASIQFRPCTYFAVSGVFAALAYLSSVIFMLLGTKWKVFAAHTWFFFGEEKLTVLIISLFLFMGFISLKIPYKKWINVIASCTFGVYLIHENLFVRTFLWRGLFKNSAYQESNMLIPYSIIVVFIIFVVGTIIDFMRQKIFERPFMAFVNLQTDRMRANLKPLCGKIQQLLKKIMNRSNV